MANQDRTASMIQDVVETGRNNLAIYPKVANWCSHLQISADQGGYVAQIYGLPGMFTIKCPHSTKGYSQMQLDVMAADFIVENCIGCLHHKELDADNFGRIVIAEKQKKDEEIRQEEEQKKQSLQKVRDEVNKLLAGGSTVTGISEASILNLLEKFDKTDRAATAIQIEEASRLEPSFFTLLSLDVLSFYFEDEEIGTHCIIAVTNVLKTKSDRPDQIKVNLERAFLSSNQTDELAGLLDLYLDISNLTEFEVSIQSVLNRLSYFRLFLPPGESEPTNENSIKLFARIIDLDSSFFTQIVIHRLSHPEKFIRYNMLGVLEELIEKKEEFIRALFLNILQCFTIEDDGYYDSPDHMVQKIIIELLKRDPQRTYPVVKEADKKLSTAARIQLWEIPAKAFRNEDVPNELDSFMPIWLKDFISIVFLKTTPAELKKEMLDDLAQMSGKAPTYFEPYFDELVGYLTTLLDEYKQFQFWLDELKSKSVDKRTTFNPLLGKDYWAVSNEEMTWAADIRHTKETIVHVFRLNEAKYFPKLQPIVKTLDSKTQADLKKELLTILGDGIKDPYVFSQFVPELYNYILDPHSIEIRIEAMKILDKMIEKYPNVVPQTFFDLIEAFVTDANQSIRKYAIELIKTVARYISTQLQDQHISFVIHSLNDKFVIVHKAAVDASETIYPFATADQQFLIMDSLYNWIYTYYQKAEPDHDFCERTTKRLLRLARGKTKWITLLTKEFVIKFCKDKEHYFSKKFLSVLEEIKQEVPALEGDWLELTLDKLTASRPYFGDNGERDDLISTVYKSQYKVLKSKITNLEGFLNSRGDNDYSDIASILAICLHFELFETTKQFSERLLTSIPDVVSTRSIREVLQIANSLAEFELSVMLGKPDIIHLNNAQNATKKD